MYQDEQAKELVRSIQRQCEKRFKNGWGGIKAISVLFRGIDKDYSKRIDEREFIDGMKNYKIDLTEQELKKVQHMIFYNYHLSFTIMSCNNHN